MLWKIIPRLQHYQHQRTPELHHQHRNDGLPQLLTEGAGTLLQEQFLEKLFPHTPVLSQRMAPGHVHLGWALPWKPPQSQHQVWGHFRGLQKPGVLGLPC